MSLSLFFGFKEKLTLRVTHTHTYTHTDTYMYTNIQTHKLGFEKKTIGSVSYFRIRVFQRSRHVDFCLDNYFVND